VVSPFSGYVKQVFFQEGQAVQAGQILVKLDADWHLASRQLARGFIYSPATGIITARRVGSGRAVQRGQPVAVLQDWSVVHLRVPVSLAQAQTLTGHDTVQVYLAELPAQRFAGTVLRVDYAAPCPTLLVQVPNRSRARITAPMQAYVQLPPLPLLSNN
jgi:multidrug resistance efflux pump